MAAPKGNKFWMQRSKHGRDKLFATPELLWQAACEYFEWCEKNPLQDTRSFGQRMVQRPYSLMGLCLYLNTNSSYFRVFKSTLNEEDKDFLTVIHDIEETIYTQQLDLASIGVFKENIIARALGLTENVKETGDKQITIKVKYERSNDKLEQAAPGAIEDIK